MSNHYDDGFLALTGHSLNLYDVGRELAAWIDLLHPKPFKVGFQDRAILSRLLALVSNTSEKHPPTIAIASEDLAIAGPMLWGIFGERLKSSNLFSVPFQAALKDHELCRALISGQPFVEQDQAEAVVAAGVQAKASRKIFLVDAEKDNLCRKLIDHALEAGPCHILIRNYAKSGSVNHYGYARDRGARVLEQADGSGEFFML